MKHTIAKRQYRKKAFTRTAYVGLAVVVIAGMLSVTNNNVAPGKTKPASSSAATACTISATLVNNCRPWLGAAAANYTNQGFLSEMQGHEARIGRPLDIVHDYRVAQGLSANDVTLAKRADTILLVNFKPMTASQPWSLGSGGNAATNANIDAMANSIKALGNTKVMLAVYHEPENDVSPGGDPNCTSVAYKGNKGSVSDYVNMWHNVRTRFDAAGVTNVVWVMNYMGYSSWNCLVKDMWPGNSYVDWVMYDPYGSTFDTAVSPFYNFLTTTSDSVHNYMSKPWGLAEWGTGDPSQSAVYSFYDQAKAALDANTYTRLKAYIVWDNAVAGGIDYRIQYSLAGALDQIEQNHYNAFASDTHFVDSSSAPTALIGDINGDGHVNTLDLSLVLTHDNQSYAAADLNHDGTVGAADLAVLLAHWLW